MKTSDVGTQATLKVKHLLAMKGTQTKTKQVAAKKPPRVSIRGFVKEQVLKGLDNAAIWALAQPRFALADVQKYYVGWYRADLVRKGDLTKAQAAPRGSTK